jgi:hypothetical protein
VSAVVAISLPTTSPALFMLDIGISINRRLSLTEAAAIWREGLLLTATALPDALSRVLPHHASPYLAELHAIAWTTDETAQRQANDLTTRLDFAPLGPKDQSEVPELGLASSIPGGLTSQQAAGIVADSIEIMALNAGFTAPTNYVTIIAQSLGLPTS